MSNKAHLSFYYKKYYITVGYTLAKKRHKLKMSKKSKINI